MSTTIALISSTDDSEGPFGLRLTYGQLNSVLDILKPQPEQPDYVVENAKFQELNAVINAYHSNGGYFYEGASSCINRYQYDKIFEVLKIKPKTGIATWIGKLFIEKKYFNDGISEWNASNVTNMQSMFCGESSF